MVDTPGVEPDLEESQSSTEEPLGTRPMGLIFCLPKFSSLECFPRCIKRGQEIKLFLGPGSFLGLIVVDHGDDLLGVEMVPGRTPSDAIDDDVGIGAETVYLRVLFVNKGLDPHF